MIDFSHNLEQEEAQTTKKSKKAKKTGYIVVFCLVFFFVFFSSMLSSSESSYWWEKIPLLGKIKHLAESADKELKGEKDDRINILLLGMGGKQHEGGYLTDTIMLASLQPSTKKVALVSIPRDMTIPVEGMGWVKINHINAYAEAKNENSGGDAISQALGDVLDMPIHYYGRVDFEGFVNIIDKLGGVTIEVENTIDDSRYPIYGQEENEDYESRFEHLYIEKGTQKMDGETALKYARSRHSVGIEGSDFARSRRQQLVIEAVKDKLLSKNLFFRPGLLGDIIEELDAHVSTNLKTWEIIKLWNLFKDTTSEDIKTKVLDNNPNGLLIEFINEIGAYVLTPRSGDFAEINYFIHNIFTDAPVKETKKVVVEQAKVEVRNGTWINGLASRTAMDLEKYNFVITKIANSSQRDFKKSIIYDLTYGEKISSLKILKEKTDASVSFNLPQWLIDDITNDLENESNTEKPDFILILGEGEESEE